MVEVHGVWDERFAPVADVVTDAIDSGYDLGISAAVTIDGEFVADMWAGWVDEDKTREWQTDTITGLWSTTKPLVALAVLTLVERGQLDVHARVADYWPEFAQNGKDEIEVRHILAHTSGLSGWDQPVTLEDLFDWETSVTKLAAQAPWWRPGTASAYHTATHSHLLGELLHRVTGRPPAEFITEELIKPLEAQVRFGVPAEEDATVALPVPPPPFDSSLMGGLDPSSVLIKTATGPVIPADIALTERWRRTGLVTAGNAFGNARGVGKLLATIANGGSFAGVDLLSQKTIDLIFDEQSHGVDQVIGIPLRWGMGFALPNQSFPYLPQDAQVCFWGGWGGSMAVVDTDRRMTITYVQNKMANCLVGNETATRLISAAYAAL